MNQENVGHFIAELRKEKNMTQQELADKLCVTDRAVSHWENGRRLPDISLLKMLSEVFEVSIIEILNGHRMSIKELENQVTKELNKILNETIKFLQKNKSDAIGLGYRIYINDYYNWVKLKDNWNEQYFPNLEVKFNIKTNLLKEEDTNEGATDLQNE